MEQYTVQTRHEFLFVAEGPRTDGAPVLLLHGMLGALENWKTTIGALAAAGHQVVAPVLPVYDLPMSETSVRGLVRYVVRFIEAIGLERPVLVGNSLGGHVALLYAIDESLPLSGLVLTGASGVHEVVMGGSTPKRFDRSYVRDRAAHTFYDPSHASEELVDQVMEIVANRSRVLRLIRMARAARDENVEDDLEHILVPTLLIWGTEDRLTPPDVALRFKERIPNARLELIPACGHAPMIERPAVFNRLLIDFLATLTTKSNGAVHERVNLSTNG